MDFVVLYLPHCLFCVFADQETGREVQINKKTGKVLRSFQEDFILPPEYSEYLSLY